MIRFLWLVRLMAASLLVAGALAVSAAAPALAHGGGGGGGGGGGSSSAPAISLSATSLTFAAQATGTTSAAQTITATDTGTADLFFSNVNITGDSLDYTITSDGCVGLTLAPGQSCPTSVTFSPTTTGTRTATLTFTDNAANSPQTVPLTGTGTGTPSLPQIDTQGLVCTGGVCSLTSTNTFVSNFFATPFVATGGSSPYTWSGAQVPSWLTLTPAGELYGTPTATGTSTFTVTVTDATGATATGTFSLTVSPQPAPSPGGSCATGGIYTEALSGSSLGGKTPSGTATANDTQFSGCGGFTTLSVTVKNVNLPNGTQLWVSFDDTLGVGIITLSNRSGAMPLYNFGDFSVGKTDQVQVYSALPGSSTFQQILNGGTFDIP
jgi:hypothetical protein